MGGWALQTALEAQEDDGSAERSLPPQIKSLFLEGDSWVLEKA